MNRLRYPPCRKPARLLASLTFVGCCCWGVAPAAAQVGPFDDALATWINPDPLQDQSVVDFSSMPIPPGFFGPGSDPFTGVVPVRGQTIDPNLGDASTIMRRGSDPFQPADPPGGPAVIPIEIVELQLTSVDPITVTFGGGATSEQWHLRVDLSPSVTPPQGQLSATKTHPNGGTFDATFFVQPRFTFTRLSDNVQAELDTGNPPPPMPPMPPLRFDVGEVPWVHQLDPGLPIVPPDPIHQFIPGVDEPAPGQQQIVPFSPVARNPDGPPTVPPVVQHTVCLPVPVKTCIYDIVCVEGDCSSCAAAVVGKCQAASCPNNTCGVLAGMTSNCGADNCCIEFGQFDCRPPTGEPPCPVPENLCTCTPVPDGACCLQTGGCVVTPPDQCAGTFIGGDCQPEQPCCLQVAGGPMTCTMMEPTCCKIQGGIVQPAGTSCTIPEACCIPDPAAPGGQRCEFIDPLCCDELGGVPQGAGTDCSDLNGNGVADVCDPPGGGLCPLADPLCATLQGVDCDTPGGVNDACRIKNLVINPTPPGGVSADLCACFPPGTCGPIIYDPAVPGVRCPGPCPDPNDQCQVSFSVDGGFTYSPTGSTSVNITPFGPDTIFMCECQPPVVTNCVPNLSKTACEPFNCPVPPQGQVCQPQCIEFNVFTGQQSVTDCKCRDTAECHAEIGPAAAGPFCTGSCPPGEICNESVTMIAPGIFKICCNCVPDTPPACQPTLDKSACEPFTCPIAGQICQPTSISIDFATGLIVVNDCNCVDECYVDFDAATGPFCVNPTCPQADQTCDLIAQDLDGDGVDETFECRCVSPPVCEPDPTSVTGCSNFQCPVAGETCLPKCVEYSPNDPFGTASTAVCDCRNDADCQPVILPGADPFCQGDCPPGQVCVESSTTDPLTGLVTLCCNCVDPTGACCVPGALCVITTQADCVNNLNGSYAGDNVPCGPIESCCFTDTLGNVICTNTETACCALLGGNSGGPGSQCTQPLKCCLPDGTCSFIDPQCCQEQGGVVSSAPNCDQSIGCCMPDGSCIDTDPECCQLLGGIPKANGTLCAPPEACCFATPSANAPLGCLDTDPDCCLAAGGSPVGPGTACSGVDLDGDGFDDACPRCSTCDDCDDGDVCTCDECDSAVGFCTNLQRKYGDIDCSGTVNIFDLFCLLDGLNNVFTTCCKSNVDIAGNAAADCTPNGSINIFDLFAFLDAINGLNNCNCVAGPAPQAPARQERALRQSELNAVQARRVPANVLLVPKQTEISAGGTFEVDVFAGSVTDMRGYEVRLHSSAGRRGDLTIVDAFVDTSRKNYAFTGKEAVVASDVAGGRFVVALEKSGISTRRPVYLGTFLLKSPRGAKGSYELSVSAGNDTFLVDSAGNAMPAENPTPVRIDVR